VLVNPRAAGCGVRDADEGTPGWIAKGLIAGSVAQKPFPMGNYGLRALGDLLHNKPAKLDTGWRRDLRSLTPAAIDTVSALIDKSHLGAFRQAANEVRRGPGALAWYRDPAAGGH
jgi:ABC-type sugar transport system substrate-binding protein